MFKELRFDVVGAVFRNEKYDAEWEALHQFSASEHKNMVIEYDTVRDTRNAFNFLTRMIKTENLQLKINTLRKTSILVKRTEDGEKRR